ncbi:nitric oxide-sensing protein NosP [Porticoccus sp.]
MSNDGQILKHYSLSRDPDIAASELFEGLYQEDTECVIFFCSVEYDLPALAKALKKQFGDTPLLGCTTAGEISPLGNCKGSITGFSLPKKSFAVEAALIENLHNFSFSDTETILQDVIVSFKRKAIKPAESHSFAFSLLDGLSIREELVLKSLHDALGEIPLVGGSAGDDLFFKDTHVFLGDKFFRNAAVMILVNTSCPFEVFSTHHLIPEENKLVVTAADAVDRVVQELNAEPAALEYSHVVGVPLEALSLTTFALHPVGVKLHDQFHIRAVQKVNDDLSLTFFCAIDEGVVLSTSRRGNLVEHLRETLESLEEKIGHPQLIIGCECILRQLEVVNLGIEDKISDLFRQYNVIGFETYGEQFNAQHVNQTFSGVAIGFPSE